MDTKTLTATTDPSTFVMAQEQQVNTPSLLSIPLEIHKIIWGYLDEGPEISVLDVEGSDEDGMVWTTEQVTRKEYEDLFPGVAFRPETPIAAHNMATSNTTAQSWPTINQRLTIIAQIMLYLLMIAWALCKGGLDVMDGVAFFLTTLSLVTALAALQTNLRRLISRGRCLNLRNRLYRAVEFMAETFSWLQRKLPIGKRLPSPRNTTTSLLLVNKQIHREIRRVYLRSHSHGLSLKALRHLCKEDPGMDLQHRESIRSIIIPPIIANNRADIKAWKLNFRRITRALLNVTSVEIRMKFSGPMENVPAGASFRAFKDTGRRENGLSESRATEERVTWEPSFFDPFRKWNLQRAIVTVEVTNEASWRNAAALGKANLEGTRFSREIRRAMLSELVWRQHLIAEYTRVSKQITNTITEGLGPFVTPIHAFVLEKRRERLESTLCEIKALVGTIQNPNPQGERIKELSAKST